MECSFPPWREHMVVSRVVSAGGGSTGQGFSIGELSDRNKMYKLFVRAYKNY
jgi:hypothetical protein